MEGNTMDANPVTRRDLTGPVHPSSSISQARDSQSRLRRVESDGFFSRHLSDTPDTTRALHRARTNESPLDVAFKASHSLAQRTAIHSSSHPSLTLSVKSDKRKVDLRLPAFNSLQLGSTTLQVRPLCSSASAPLTPPPDDLASEALVPSASVPHHDFSKSSTAPISGSPTVPSDSHQSRATAVRRMAPTSLGESIDSAEDLSVQGCPWVIRACRAMLSIFDESHVHQQISIVSQTMPSQAKDSRTKPTFEEVLETTQLENVSSPFITITHAVPQARVMQELPKTPPTTPGIRHDTNDYFGSDQTIFTHGAVVPIYHNHGPVVHVTQRIPHLIAVPQSVHMAILERYIPPTMVEEITDFFSTSTRSYLSDRLFELSPNNGSLMLVYPTRSGGRTFARKYVGPVIDPLLRQLMLLNDLTSDAAAAMGNMEAIDHMLEFEEIRARIETLCANLSQRTTVRGRKSAYRLAYQEKTEVVLPRSDWINWYVEQEQSRLRQNLVEYHHAGGRMPGSKGHSETTVGMLTREVISGIQKSTEPSGSVGIEIGVFVITSCA